jgi:hypothetical protein
MILYSGYNIIKLINIIAFVILFILTYKGIFIINEEILVAICFILFISLAVILLSDVVKASIFSKIIQIKNKFNDFHPLIEKENNNFYNTCNNIGNIKIYENTEYNEIVKNYINENKSDIFNIFNKINNKKINNIFNTLNKYINNIQIYDTYLGLRIELIILLYTIINYIYYVPLLLISYIYNNIINKNNDIYLIVLNYIKYKEYRYSIIIYKYIVRELFIYYSNLYKIPKKYINKIIKNKNKK